MLVFDGDGRACLGIDSGVRDFRWDAGAWNMVVGFAFNVQLVGFVTFIGNSFEQLLNGR